MRVKLTKTRRKRVTYPTGMVCERQVYANPSGTIKVEIEEELKPPRNGIDLGLGRFVVSGSMIPKGASGFLCHETLPTEYFRTRPGAERFALRVFRHFAPSAQ